MVSYVDRLTLEQEIRQGRSLSFGCHIYESNSGDDFRK